MFANVYLTLAVCFGAIFTLWSVLAAFRYQEKYIRADLKARSSREMIENLAEGVYRTSLEGKQLRANKALVQLNGYETEAELLESVKDIALEWYVDPDRRADFQRELKEKGVVTDFVSEIYRHKTRERIWISENAHIVYHPRSNKPLYYEGTVRDITDTIKKTQSDKLLKDLTDKLPHGLFRLVRHPDGSFTCPYVSKRFREMVDLPDGKEFRAVVFTNHVHPEDIDAYLTNLKKSRRNGSDWNCQFRFIRADGSIEWCKISATPEDGKNGDTIWHGYLSNISARKAAEEKVHRLAYFDTMTGLSNRTHFLNNAKDAITEASVSGIHLALGFIDLDNFKLLNDTHGHGFGDKLLKAVAGRLEESLPQDTLLSRFGGDEFVLMLKSHEQDPVKARLQIEKTSQMLLKEIQKGFLIDDIDCPMTMSLGMSIVEPRQEVRLGDLLKSADVAMYEAKKSGRNNAVVHDSRMLEKVADKYKLQRDLQIAIKEGQLEIELQPQVTQRGRIACAETLTRWNHPLHGRIMPSEFIDLAEQTGQIGRLNEWVLKRIITLLAEWQLDPALCEVPLSVNISPRQMLDPQFPDRIIHLLKENKVPGNLLVLELTEHVMARDPETVEKHMRRLQAEGLRFSLDDFGTGYSSISQLRQFPFDELKVDGSFVTDVAEQDEAKSLVTAILNMAKALGLRTVAEHVSDQKQYELLATLDCNMFQGYLFSRPLRVEDFMTLVQAQNTTANSSPVDERKTA